MKVQLKRKFIWSASLGFALWLTAFYLFHYQLKYKINEEDVKKFEKAFQKKSAELDDNLKSFFTGIQNREEEDKQFDFAKYLASTTHVDYFIYTNDSLTLWTSNNVPISTIRDTTIINGNIALLANGWYKFEFLTTGNSVYVAALLIKKQFDYENEDLINAFSPHLLPDFKGKISLTGEGYPVHNKYGKPIFSIEPADEIERNTNLELIIFISYLFSFLILLQLLINAFQKILLQHPIILILFPLSIVLLRYFWLKSGWVGAFERFELFSPELFASKNIPSLGDLIINITIFYFLVHFLLKRTRNWFKEGNRKLKLVVFVFPIFILSFWVAFEINSIIKTLVNDSQIKFDLEHLFDLNIYSFISIAIIGAVFYTYFRLIQYLIIQFKKSAFELNKLAFTWALTSLTYIIVDQIISDHAILTSFWPIFMSGTLLWFEYKEKEYKFVHIISVLAFVSFYAAFILKGYNDNKEHKDRKSLAEYIAKDRNETAEDDYNKIEKNLKESGFLLKYFQGDFSQNKLNLELESGPFNKLKKDYALNFYLFKSNFEMVEDFNNYDLKDYSHFIQIIRESGVVSTINPHIYFIKDYRDKLSYIAHHRIISGDSLNGYLFTELRSKKFPDDIGLPALLLEEKVKFADQLKNYSIAKYVDHQLVTQKGDYSYPLVSADNFNHVNSFETVGAYSHYVFESEPGYKTVLSKKVSSGFALFTSFSYVLIIFGLLLMIPLVFKQMQTEISFRNIKFNVKIQTVLIGLILTTLVVFAIGAWTFVEQQHEESNKGLIKEKITSVKIEVESKLKDAEILGQDLSSYLEYLVKKFSKVFLTDINLFTLQGDLLASSQPTIYSKGLLSEKMNPDAYHEMHCVKNSEFVHQEQVGELNYLSAYMPFFNKNGVILAYLNVQYISRQGELESQLSAFLLAIINIMVLMLALSTILAITVSNRLTRPLKHIQDSLKNMQIGSVSKPILYTGTDEIGELVKEYNKKVEELQINAEQLAKSERESAWREMAKQVAHEIKNPLTPMKLSIQHLKRSIKLADQESKDKMDRMTSSLIEQIDALSQIANAFSNFAKMPKANEVKLDLVEILKNAIVVFEDQEEYDIDLIIEQKNETIIWADKDLLLRVFNNLIKNATQAIRNVKSLGRKGNIRIELEETADYFVVMVKDNGIGISEEQKEKIFVPYFTTKSTGTGLGLAMSKQIIENLGGAIWFESVADEGTAFYVSFKKMRV